MTPERRARSLLLSHLSPQQRQTLGEHGWFEVVGGKTGWTYRIHQKLGRPIEDRDLSNRHCPAYCLFIGRNVTRMKKGKRIASYDARPFRSASLPDSDDLLAQKLALENRLGEIKFLNMACKTEHLQSPTFWPWGVVSIFCGLVAAFSTFNLANLIWRLLH